jgi:dTDP-4-dehydrorhamnose reductase
MKNVLLIGSGGNLGFELNNFFGSKNYKLFITSKNPARINEIRLENFKPIIIPKNIKIDLIINAANKYYTHPNYDETKFMKNAILGVSQSILESNMDCPIVYFSSYLQYLPRNLQPWSVYTEMKSEATEIIKKYGNEKKTTALEITLYDNYGGKRKNKFFDLALDSIINNVTLNATKGETVVNLTHIYDIVQNLELFVDRNYYSFNKNSHLSYSMQTNDTYNLKDLVIYINKVSKKQVQVEWGALPYRSKEVFQYYNTKPILPSFLQYNTLEAYILSRLNNYLN